MPSPAGDAAAGGSHPHVHFEENATPITYAESAAPSPASTVGDRATMDLEIEEQGLCSALPWYFWILLNCINGVHALSTDAWLPNIVSVQHDFGVSAPVVALTLQLNMLAVAPACTLVGSLADRVGRRRTLVLAFLAYAVGSALVATCWQISVLLAGRVVMGLGAGGQTLAQVLLRDLVDDAALRQQAMAALWAMSPLLNVLGPLVGGAIGWRGVGWLGAAWGVLVALGSALAIQEQVVSDGIPKDASLWSLPSTASAASVDAEHSGRFPHVGRVDRAYTGSSTGRALRSRIGSVMSPFGLSRLGTVDALGSFVRSVQLGRADSAITLVSHKASEPVSSDLLRIMRSRLFVGASGLYALVFAAIGANLTLLPFVLEQHYGLSTTAVGGLMGFTSISMILGSSLSFLLGKRLEPLPLLRATMLPLALLTALTAALAGCPGALQSLGFSPDTWWPVLVPSFCLVLLQGVLAPVCQTLYLEPFKDIAGLAAGAAGLAQTLLMAVASAAASAAWELSGTPQTFYGALAAAMVLVQLWFWPLLGLSSEMKAPRRRKLSEDPELARQLLEAPSSRGDWAAPAGKARAVRFADA